jgi:hypothetical protein
MTNNDEREAQMSALADNPLFEALKLAVGMLSLHGYDDEAKKVVAEARSAAARQPAAALEIELRRLSQDADDKRRAEENPNLERIWLGMRDAYDIAANMAAKCGLQPAAATGQSEELQALIADNARLLDSLTKESAARCELEDKLAAATGQEPVGLKKAISDAGAWELAMKHGAVKTGQGRLEFQCINDVRRMFGDILLLAGWKEVGAAPSEDSDRLLYCLDCKCVHPGEYMVTSEVWESSGLGCSDGALCLPCLEKRLGRKVSIKDFINEPINRVAIHMWQAAHPDNRANLTQQQVLDNLQMMASRMASGPRPHAALAASQPAESKRDQIMAVPAGLTREERREFILRHAAESKRVMTDEEILAMNAGEIYFSETPSRYPEAGHGTQYHCGAPGLLKFARALLARAASDKEGS